MGTLALAGVVSGAGKGLERGFANAQQTLSTAWLQEQQREWDTKRQERLMAHETAQSSRQIASAEKIHESGETAAERRLAASEKGAMERTQTTAGAGIVAAGMREAGEKERHKETQATAREELGVRKSYYAAQEARQKRMETRLGLAAQGKGGKAAEVVSSKDILKAMTDLHKQLADPSLDDERREEIEGDLAYVRSLRDKKMGANETTRKTDEISDDPFKSIRPGAAKAPTPAAPRPPVATPQRSPFLE